MRVRWVAACALAAVAACGQERDQAGAAARSPATSQDPSERPPGYGEVLLVAANPDARFGAAGPTGRVWYREVDGAFTWYLRASGLEAGRAYRVEMATSDPGKQSYAVGSSRTDAEGTLTAHGVERALENHYCVDATAGVPEAMGRVRQLTIAVKDDGSPGGQSMGSPTSSAGSLPCSGNGDNDFTYRLYSVGTLQLDPHL